MDGIDVQLGVEEDTGVNYLEIIGVTPDHQGNYTCQITTPVGTLENTGVLEVNGICELLCTCIHTYIASVYVTGLTKVSLTGNSHTTCHYSSNILWYIFTAPFVLCLPP